MSVTVHEPTTQAAALSLLQQEPEALLMAGGTHVMRSAVRHEDGRPVISLRRVDTLSRVSRTQRHLEIGAAVSLARVLSIGPRVVPACLFAALKATASPTVRVLATLGGNACASGAEHTCLAALSVLDAQLELRTGGAARYVPAAHFWAGGAQHAIRPPELLIRVRVPLEELALEAFSEETVAWGDHTARAAFAVVAALYKETVEELRFCLSTPWFGALRFGDFEGACSGVRLPLRERTIEQLLAALKRAVVQRLGLTIAEVTPLLSVTLRQAGRFLRRLSGSQIDRSERSIWLPRQIARPWPDTGERVPP